MQEMDRACRAKIRGNFLSRESPEKLEKQIVEDNSNIDVHSGYNLRRRPRRLSFKFNALSNDINESGLSEVDYLLRQVLKKWFISDACLNDISDTADFRSIYSIGTSSSNNISYSSLIVPELDGMSVRIYDGDGKLTNQRVTHYHCARCDDFYQKRDDESLRVILKAENDLVVNYPVHHPECSPTSLESLRELGDKLKDFSVVANHRIIPLRTVLVSILVIHPYICTIDT
ncbi:unnamed protein product [Onchocerca ochengi]|uniref:RYYR-CCHC domain-containing protein n=1 Tax=Onchocerca ochengi TaxID=42157 RepID=A0A182EV29_ONCOC|nr:unnamed protein product [Onchocerca ochengi]